MDRKIGFSGTPLSSELGSADINSLEPFSRPVLFIYFLLVVLWPRLSQITLLLRPAAKFAETCARAKNGAKKNLAPKKRKRQKADGGSMPGQGCQMVYFQTENPDSG
jgi:hypothetical protein